MVLLDSNVAVDLLRGRPPALAWWASLAPGERPAIPGYVELELIDGCRSAAEAAAVQRLLKSFSVHWLTPDECEATVADYRRVRLANAIDPMDILIGHTALKLGVPLYTFNQKHFKVIPGLTTLRPYVR